MLNGHFIELVFFKQYFNLRDVFISLLQFLHNCIPHICTYQLTQKKQNIIVSTGGYYSYKHFVILTLYYFLAQLYWGNVFQKLFYVIYF